MNRRGFFRALAATAVVTLAAHTRLGQLTPTARHPQQDEIERAGEAYVRHLARSMIETKETLAANILNMGFDHG